MRRRRSRPIRLRALRRLDERLEAQDRRAERVEVLEALITLLTRSSERRAVLGALARSAAALRDFDRAEAAWERCLAAEREGEPNDREALDGLCEVLLSAERWRPLVAALRRRMAAATGVHQRRADLEQIARLEAGPLANAAAAIEAWREHERTFGPTATGEEALAELLAASASWDQLGALLSEMAGRNREQAAAFGVRVGDLCRGHLGALEGAATWYRWALQADPQAAGARAGLWTLLDGAAPRAVQVTATAALAAAAADTDDWALTLRLVEARLALAAGSAEKAELLREAARLAESRAKD